MYDNLVIFEVLGRIISLCFKIIYLAIATIVIISVSGRFWFIDVSDEH